MGHQVMRQPDGRLAVFSSGTDTIILSDATEDELLDWYADRAAEAARRDTQQILDAVLAGEPERVYFQFTRTWESVLADDREHGGSAWRVFAERATDGD